MIIYITMGIFKFLTYFKKIYTFNLSALGVIINTIYNISKARADKSFHKRKGAKEI